MRITRRSLVLVVLPLVTGAPAAVVPRPAVAARQSAVAPVDLVRLAWADVGVPTPFRVSTAGPGGPVLLTLLYDTLTWKDEEGIIPWLATAWTVSADGLDYTFDLTPGVQWHDGQPLTAEDVVFSFDYYAAHPYRWTNTAAVASASVIAPDQVRVRLVEPFAPFLDEIAGGVPIIPRHVWAEVDDPLTHDGPDASVGSGPYMLAEYQAADGAYQLMANPDYFRGPVLVDEFQQLNTPPETQIQAVRQGDLDLAYTPDASVAGLFADDPRVSVFATAPQSIVRLAVNTERAPLDRVEVRQAIAYALDRAQIATVVTRGEPIVGDGVIPPESPWFNPDVSTYPFDPERGRELLGGETYTIELLAGPANREPELMAPMLEAVGITLDTKRVDGPTRTQLLREGNFRLGLIQHIGTGGDPDFLRRWYAGEEANDYAQGSIFADPEFHRLAREQATMLDQAQRRATVDQMQVILAEELPTIVLYHRRFYWVYDSTRLAPMDTWGGLLNGVPFVHNKLIFLPR
ncbi:MAG: ABC transporter substrate-binding protein [Chloroflexota bacterium]|nr:ABC transporter substrate-binding protein [Chloroflexota bacterium]